MQLVRRVWILAVLLAAPAAWAQDDKVFASIDWQKGPTTAQIGNQAQLKVPEGYMYAGPAGTRKFLEILENIPGDEVGMLTTPEYDWFILFSFDDVGYVKDDEKDSLNADQLLASIRESTAAGNEERRSRGWSTMSVTGWVVKPNYETTTSNLEWSFKVRDDEDGLESVNHRTRYLGRRGVMNVELVADVKGFETTLGTFREAMKGFSYENGKDYRSFVPGDKVAEYGLTALVLGGGAAAAAKAGLLKSLWKIILAGWKAIAVGLVALGGLLKRLFTGKKQPEPAQEV